MIVKSKKEEEKTHKDMNELQKRAKAHRRKQKGMSPFSSLNPNAGDENINTQAFNSAMGGGMCEAFIGEIEEVIELPDFEDARKELGLSDADIEVAKKEIIENPNIGDVIQGAHGARKLRIVISANGKGKSGGARGAYLNYYPGKVAYLLDIIVKDKQSDFTNRQIKQLAKAVDVIKEKGGK